MSSVETGRAGEQLATEHLVAKGFAILARNWRNRWCELDIVARHQGVIHFIEVKYRADIRYGYAAEYISRDKSARLMRAALAWNQAHGYDGPYQVDVITIEGGLEQPRIAHLENVVGEW